jgi:hypothetical protein
MKLIASGILFVSLLMLIQCRPKQHLFQNRVEVIHQAIAAISKYDTSTLYNLVDTSYYFDIYGKEGFLHTIERINTGLQKCKSKIDDNAIKVVNTPVNTTSYILNFCKPKNDTATERIFELNFKFADYQNTNRIMTFEINYLKPKEIMSTEPSH